MWSLGWNKGSTSIELKEVVENLKIDYPDYEGIALNYLSPNDRILNLLGNKQGAILRYKGINVMEMVRSRILEVLNPKAPTLLFIGCYDCVDKEKGEIEIVFSSYYISNIDSLMNENLKVIIIDTAEGQKRVIDNCEIVHFASHSITLHINGGKKNRKRISREKEEYVSKPLKTYPSDDDDEYAQQWGYRNNSYPKQSVVKYEAPVKKVVKRPQTIVLECEQ